MKSPRPHLLLAAALAAVVFPSRLAATNGFTTTATNGYGITIAHRQLNTQLMYSYRF